MIRSTPVCAKTDDNITAAFSSPRINRTFAETPAACYVSWEKGDIISAALNHITLLLYHRASLIFMAANNSRASYFQCVHDNNKNSKTPLCGHPVLCDQPRLMGPHIIHRNEGVCRLASRQNRTTTHTYPQGAAHASWCKYLGGDNKAVCSCSKPQTPIAGWVGHEDTLKKAGLSCMHRPYAVCWVKTRVSVRWSDTHQGEHTKYTGSIQRMEKIVSARYSVAGVGTHANPGPSSTDMVHARGGAAQSRSALPPNNTAVFPVT